MQPQPTQTLSVAFRVAAHECLLARVTHLHKHQNATSMRASAAACQQQAEATFWHECLLGCCRFGPVPQTVGASWQQPGSGDGMPLSSSTYSGQPSHLEGISGLSRTGSAGTAALSELISNACIRSGTNSPHKVSPFLAQLDISKTAQP